MAYKAERDTGLNKTAGKPGSGGGPAGNVSGSSLSKLSHDIRTQLYIIIGFAELMLEEVPGKINEEQRRSLNDVLTSGRRLEALMNDIVERSKSSRDRGERP